MAGEVAGVLVVRVGGLEHETRGFVSDEESQRTNTLIQLKRNGQCECDPDDEL